MNCFCEVEGCVPIGEATDGKQAEVFYGLVHESISRYIMREKVSEWNINCENEAVFFLYPNTQNTNKFITARPDGCIPPSSVQAANVTFNRMTKTIYHAFTYTLQHKTG